MKLFLSDSPEQEKSEKESVQLAGDTEWGLAGRRERW